ncbi:MAG: hypothetical protein U0931_21530 [Vulcanimicrobiota bacterium]
MIQSSTSVLATQANPANRNSAPAQQAAAGDGYAGSVPSQADELYKGDPALMPSQAKKGDEMLYLALGVAIGCVCCASNGK